MRVGVASWPIAASASSAHSTRSGQISVCWPSVAPVVSSRALVMLLGSAYRGANGGFDVHTRAVVGCGLDRSTGEVFERWLTPDHRKLLEWIRSLAAPAVVTYDADGICVGPGIGVGEDRLPSGRAVEVPAPSRE